MLRRVSGFAADTAVAGLAFFCAYLLLYGFDRLPNVGHVLLKTVIFMLVAAVSYLVFSLHRTSWRYVSIPDILQILKACVTTIFVFTVGAFLVTRGQNIPRSVIVFAAIFMVAGLTGVRLVYRLAFERRHLFSLSRKRAAPLRYVLLCGLSDGAESFIRAVSRTTGKGIRVVGIIDDNDVNSSRYVRGVKVVGKLSDLPAIVERLAARGTRVTEIIVTENAPSRHRLGEVVEIATKLSLKTSRIPGAVETAAVTTQNLAEPKPIEIGDLLGRPEVNSNIAMVAEMIRNRSVFVSGAGGSIGSELCRQIAMFEPRRLVIVDSSEFQLYTLDKELRGRHPALDIATRIGDVRDANRIGRLFAQFKPEVVFHAAALKHVPLVEDNPIEGIKTNVFGTANVADAAYANGASTFVMISTDKAVNPTNVMGATKRVAESYCQRLDLTSTTTRFKTVRFGNVLGSNGSVVPHFQEQIAAGGPVTVTHPEITRYFMTIPEAVRLVLHASAETQSRSADRGEIMVLDMGQPVKIVDLAERMIQLAGFRPRVDIDIVFTGLRPGEKLYEELFDTAEMQNSRAGEGFVVASPRLIDRALLDTTMANLREAIEKEDVARAVALLGRIVPEYDGSDLRARKPAGSPPIELVPGAVKGSVKPASTLSQGSARTA